MEEFESLVDAEVTPAPRGTIAQAAITQDDREIDQMLERMAKTNPIQDLGPEVVLKREPIKRDTLRNHVDGYKPASTIMELDEQVFQAKGLDIDSIEGTSALVRHFCKREFEYIKANVGYIIYHDIRVYIDGFFEQNKDADKMTMEQRLHSGGAKIDIGPIITPQKV